MGVSEIRLLVVPYELDRLRRGIGRGPEQLLEAGAEKALGASGAMVRTEVLELNREYSNEIQGCFEVIKLIASRVRAAGEERAFPVVLSGSCYASIGIVAGLRGSPGVVWFDAHGDFNTPETTDLGYFDGMGLAVLTGAAWQTMLAGVDGAQPLPETSVLLAGARDLDPSERDRIDASRVAHLPPDRLRPPDRLLKAMEGMSPAPDGLHVHVDLDVLDSGEATVNVYSAPDGINGVELHALVAALIETGRVRALALTAYDPECDSAGAVPPLAMSLLEATGSIAAKS